MAQQYTSENGTFVVPGSYLSVKVQNAPSTLATAGVIALIGESTAGPRFDAEDVLGDNAWGPDQVGEFTAKYGSGPLVDAFRAAIAASNDPDITGSFSRIIAVKTNESAEASGTILAIGGGSDYGTLVAKSAGKAGNMITRTITENTAEVVPTTGEFLIAPPQQSTVVNLRVNGGTVVTTTLTTGQLPTSMVSALDALTNIDCTGGTNRALIDAGIVTSGTIAVSGVDGYSAVFTISSAWATIPTVGDLLYIPTGSPFTTANEGSYVITEAAASVLTATKLLDAAGSGAVLTAPSAEAGIDPSATTDIQAFAPVEISVEAAAVAPGKGKSLEIAESGSENFAVNCFVFDGANEVPPASAADFISTALVPTVIVSESEYIVDVNFARQTDGINETITVGGDVVLKMGYDGTTASAVIADGVMTITVTGGAGTSPAAITLADYPTINDLCAYLNTLTGFVAAPGTLALGQLASVDLDEVTCPFASEHGTYTGRIKMDGAEFLSRINSESTLCNIEPIDPAEVLIGLPATATLGFLTSGTLGSTTNTDISEALTALEAVSVNFVVPLMSRDAVEDIADDLTSASSTYTIDSINAAVRAHCITMSGLKRRRRRIALLSHRGTFVEAQNAAGNLASARCLLAFQDVKDVDSTGTIVQFQPWMAAVKAAAMQAAGGYKAIVNKFVSVSGIVHPGTGFNDQLNSNLETALTRGLCPLTKDENGGFRWVSDQTTYSRDSNFVFNSLQAMYAVDILSATVEQRMGRAFVGQSVADISASLAKTTLEAILDDMRRLKLLAPSDDAPSGYRNTVVRIVGPAMTCSFEGKLAGAIYFVVINALITPVQQSAG